MQGSARKLEEVRETTLAEQLGNLRLLLPYLWRKGRPGFKLRIILSLLVILLGTFITVQAPLVLADGINRLAETDMTGAAIASVFGFIIGYGVLRFLSVVIPNLREFLFARVGQTAQREVGVDVFRHLQNLSLRFHLERKTGSLSRIMERGNRSIDFLFRFLLFNIGPTLILLGYVCVIFAARYEIALSLIAAVTVIGYFWFTIASTEWRLKFRRKMNEKDQLASSRSVDALLNFETVKLFGAEKRETERFSKALEDYQDAAIRSNRSLAWVNIGQAAVVNGGMVAALGITALGVAEGRYGIGEVTGVSLIMMQLYQPLNILGFAYREIKQSLIDMEKMFDLLKIEPEVKDAPGAQDLDVDACSVRFDDVHFGYDPRRAVLKGLSFEAEAGKKTAIVGPSGAGKSTIARLIFRFYDVTQGAITIGGTDIRDVTQDSVRRNLGVVPQDTVLFNDTISYNISYPRPEATKDEIERAAQMAQIHEFVSRLPDGYETLVGERGLKLSGGEKQRVAIARTIIKNPPILILDEATSALDSETEAEILTSLNALASGRTSIVIAHRLSTIIDADKIVVVDGGVVAEEGTHEELLGKGGLYARLWKQQSSTRAREEFEQA
ncbi:ABCB family ABC transporter ATP-binding protein/permease [Parvularcula lutaonensis]|uniref:ABCB family ABC transporter ATP-binding protein/permease n=1 Tax=Parvularcula lutaonensis TaxID=491923 RepID=A0ABV7ME85_9PROT|nr:ABC transporter ATP-binding protein/permease [Parvularcula lutaonensis]GGY39079.1 ABC transporter ATP-binding protein [Parvularcula lutaonensis]